MTVKTWWSVLDVIEMDAIIPIPVFIIKCNGCGEEYETYTLIDVPQECPDCGKRNEVE